MNENIKKMGWLLQVDKPARYTGDELNIVRKEPGGKLRFALCFPDVYEVGMSHLGSRILYDVLNGREDVYCERCYAPWIDAEAQLRAHGQRLYALETGDELAAFDVLGFSLLYEMSYTNILNMLDLSGIPLRSSERNDTHPLIAAGGPCACNAEPIADFIDVIMFGDGEDIIQELAEQANLAKQEGIGKERLLARLAGIPGFYVPSMYDIAYNEDNTVKAIMPKQAAHVSCATGASSAPAAPSLPPAKVQRRILRDLDASPYPVRPIVPFTSIIHDRAVLELFRGCTRGCRFCQAGYIYRPIRERSVDTLLRQADEIIDNTGYDEISLTSLSSGDYSQLERLIDELGRSMDEKRVSLALPSLRIDSFRKSFAEGTARVRKSGLTFAPEAGTQRLRDVINKGVDEADLLRSVRSAFEAGYTTVKLYFMIGLPTETDEDILGIAELTKKVVEAYYSLPAANRPKPPQVNVSASPFVPKPFTPFQWVGQDSLEEIARKQQLLRDAFKGNKRVKFSSSDGRLSRLEAAMSRGDRRLSRVIEAAWRSGARMDGWSEVFDYGLWMAAFEQEGIDPDFYITRQREEGEVFPYEHMDVGVSREYLLAELHNSRQGKVTGDCRDGCLGCGLEGRE